MPRSICPAFAGVIFPAACTSLVIITLPPTRATFVRMTQTETAADAPPWSIRNLRIYEAPAASAKK